jgi:hypothetical protein
VKAFLNPYNRVGDYIYHLAHYMLAARCRHENEDDFTKFIDLVASTDWSASPPPHSGSNRQTTSYCFTCSVIVTAHHM